MAARIKVMIADSQPLVREGLSTILNAEEDMDLVGEAADGVEWVDLARELRPDVVVVDLETSKLDGLAVIRDLAAEQPNVRFLLLSSLTEDKAVHEAYRTLKASALACLLKDADTHQVVAAIRLVYQGTTVLHPEIAGRILADHQSATGTEQLTPREMEVLGLVAEGLRNKEIARCLAVTEQTVLSHVRNIFRKLHLGNRTEAALYAREHGLG